MRVTARARREESGAVLVLVALGLVALIGLLVLTVDLGRMIAIRREMVRAADAAALAAAQECAFGHGSGAARTAALDLATQNRSDASIAGIPIDPQCDHPTSEDTKLVTVRLSTTVDMFFAQIFGYDTRPVTAQATAMWSAPGPIPISVEVVPLNACRTQTIPPPTEDHPCVFDYPMETLENPRWGILNLSVWGDGDASFCPVPNSEIVDIIDRGGWGSTLDPNPPTWDCLDNGAQFASWMELEGRTVWFPVIDVAKSKGEIIPGNQGACLGSQIDALKAQGLDCRITTAWVLEFVKMKVISVSKIGSTHVLEMVPVASQPSSQPGIEVRLVD